MDFFLAPFFLSKETDDIMATISLERRENVDFVNKSQLWLVEPKIPGTRNTEAYQLHGHTPTVGTAHDRSSTRSIQVKEHWNGIHNMKLSLKGTSSLGTNLGKGEEKAQITLRNI